MKEATFLTIDYTIQVIIGVLMLFFLPFLYGLMLLIPFGIWQNISSLTMVYCYKDQKRIPHLIFTVIWGCIFLVGKEASHLPFFVSFSYIIILPACIGLWYFLQTKKDLKLMEGEEVEEKEYV